MPAFEPRQPFRRSDALAAGITPRALSGGGYRRLVRGVYVSADVVPTLAVRARAVQLVAPEDAVVSHHTAARLWGGVVPDTADVDIAILRDERMDMDGVHPHRLHTRPPTRARYGLRVVDPATTFVHLAQDLDLVDLVVLGDSLVRRKATTCSDLVTAARRNSGRHTRLARRAAELVRTGVDSPPETRLRLLMVLAGLPEPVVDHQIRDARDHLRYRLDLALPEVKLAIEYDGRRFHEPTERRSPDLIRREDLEGEDWTFVVVVAEDLFDEPDRTLARIVRALLRLGVPIPRRLDDRWRRHFPGRRHH